MLETHMNSIHMGDGKNCNTVNNPPKNTSDEQSQISAHQVVLEVKDSNQTFACEKCGKPVPNNQMAKRLHMDKYHDEKLIKYTPGRAESNRTPNKSIVCEMCELTCQSKPNLKRHMATTHAIPVKRNLTRSELKRKLPDEKGEM